MAVAHELARLAPRHGEAKAENHVVQSALEQLEQHRAGHALPLRGLFKIVAELRLEQVVDSLDPLFLTQLFAVADRFAPRVRAVLPGRIGPPLFDRARGLVALLAFEVELHPLTPAHTTLFASISCQLSSSENPGSAPRFPPLNSATLGRTAAVVWDRRHVADQLDVDARALDGANRRLASRSRPFHTHFDRAHPAVARYPGGLVGGLLGGERSAFA